MIILTDQDFDDVINCHQTGMPLKYWSRYTYTSNPMDGWDIWENERYLEEEESCLKLWQKIMSFVRRYIKLHQKRKLNPLYCNKSARNYSRVLHRKKELLTHVFKYVGTQYQ